jgi:hypothetical protein
MPEFAAAWAGDVNALRAVEAELSATKSLLVAANLRTDDLQSDLDKALADNNRLNVRNAYLEAQVLTFADRARDAEHGMAAIAERAGQVVRGDGTTRDRASAAAPIATAPVTQIIAAPEETAAPVAPRQVREIDAGAPDGTDLPQEPPPIASSPLPPGPFLQAAQ